STVCGGGRYDGLVQQLDGPALCGIGFGMGLTRIILAMKESGALIPEAPKPVLYIAPMGDNARATAIKYVAELRNKGIYAECDICARSLKAQMKYADKIGAHYTLIIGDSELESGKAQLKDMTNSTQEEIEISNIVDIILKK
ncbi:MAG: histidine--tRNA ligase, partial [Clostridia bacterium]|nr:histidine--tRNA ligase [Clostridia bacterium]